MAMRKKYKIGDIVLYTKKKGLGRANGTWITHIVSVARSDDISGYPPYLLQGFGTRVGRKQLSLPTSEHKLIYVLDGRIPQLLHKMTRKNVD